MDLYIQIKNNEPFEHPITDWNMKMIFPNLDPENPPEGFARFHREPHPELTFFQIVDKVTYELSNYYTDLYKTKTWTDVYHIRDKTQEELNIKEEEIIDAPPKPDDGKEYFWVDEIKKWVEYDAYEKVFGDFLRKNNLKYGEYDMGALDTLTEAQKKEFKKLIEKYVKITNSKW